MAYSHFLRLPMAALGMIAWFTVGVPAARAQSVPFDYNGDGFLDSFEVTHTTRGVIKIYSGFDHALLKTMSGPVVGEGFASTVLVVPDLSGDGAPDFLISAPLAQPTGKVYAKALSGIALWTIAGPADTKIGYDLTMVVDQDRDGVPDVLLGGSDLNGTIDRTVLVSGRRGVVLATFDAYSGDVLTYAAGGGRLFVPSDLDGSGVVDQEDLIEFFDFYVNSDQHADVNGDGQVTTEDLMTMLDDVLRSVTTLKGAAMPIAPASGQGGTGGGSGGGMGQFSNSTSCPPPDNSPCVLSFPGLQCPNQVPLGSCLSFSFPPASAPSGCTQTPCWMATGSLAPVRVENGGTSATFCFNTPGLVEIWVYTPGICGGTNGDTNNVPNSNGSDCHFGWYHCSLTVVDCSASGAPDARVVMAPNGNPACSSEGPLWSAPRVVAPATTGWVDMTDPNNPVWREGIVVEGYPAGGIWSVAYMDDSDANEDGVLGYTIGQLSPSLGLPIARAWGGQPLPDMNGWSRTWLMFRTSAAVLPEGKRGAKFRFTYSMPSICSADKTLDVRFDVTPDSDGDQIPDRLERFPGTSDNTCPRLCTSAGAADTDGNGVPDGVAIQLGADPCGLVPVPLETDADRDHTPDAAELALYHTSPSMFDTDSDGVQDDTEIALGLDPLNPLSDGTPDRLVASYRSRDLDNDGIDDLWELQEGLVTALAWSRPDSGLPRSGDPNYPVHPNSDDQDYDGVQDGLEIRLGLDPLVADQNPTALAPETDRDGDGVSDDLEARLGTNPDRADTDNDGVRDGTELRLGLNPRSAMSYGDGIPDADRTYGGMRLGDKEKACLDPTKTDTDGDGEPDATDPMPHTPGPNPSANCPSPDSQLIAVQMSLYGGWGGHAGSLTLSGGTGGYSGANGPTSDGPGGTMTISTSSGTGGGEQWSTCTDVPCTVPPPPPCVVCFKLPCPPDSTYGSPGDHRPAFRTDTWYNYRFEVPCGPDGRPGLDETLKAKIADPSGDPCYDLAPEFRPDDGTGGVVQGDNAGHVPHYNACRSCQGCGDGRCIPGTVSVYQGQVRWRRVLKAGIIKAVELIIDDTNEHGFEVPTPHSAKGPGKIILVDSSDPDLDGIPAFADFEWSPPSEQDVPGIGQMTYGGTPQPFVPVVVKVTIPPGSTGGTIRFNYSASDPNQLTADGGPPAGVNKLDWHASRVETSLRGFRLWKVDSIDELETPRNLTNDYIATGVAYDLSTFFGSSGGGVSKTVYLEAVTPSPSACGQIITATVDFGAANPAGGCGLSDSVVAIGARVDVLDLRGFSPRRALEGGGDRLAFDRVIPTTTNAEERVGGAITDGASPCVVLVTPELPIKTSISITDNLGQPLIPPDGADAYPEEYLGGFQAIAARSGALQPISAMPVSGRRKADPWRANIALDKGGAVFVPPPTYRLSNEWTSIGFTIRADDAVIGTHTFNLRRPPIVLVHGLFGEKDDYWGSYAYSEGAVSGVGAFNGRPVSTRLYFADYKSTNTAGYDRNYGVVPKTIRDALFDYWTANDGAQVATSSTNGNGECRTKQRRFSGVRYAASQADVIGHSLGGQNVRFYVSQFVGSAPRMHGVPVGSPTSYEATRFESISVPSRIMPVDFGRCTTNNANWWLIRPDNMFAGDIHRFVAIGSPFEGSPLATDAMEAYSPRNMLVPDKAGTRGFGFVFLHANAWRDSFTSDWASLADLAEGSTAQLILQRVRFPGQTGPGVQFPTGRREVVWAPIAGRCSRELNPSYWERLFSGLPLQARLYRRLGSGDSDGVVLVSSQLNSVVPESDPLRVFGSHQHSEMFPNLNTSEAQSPPIESAFGVGNRIAERLPYEPEWFHLDGTPAFWLTEGLDR